MQHRNYATYDEHPGARQRENFVAAVLDELFPRVTEESSDDKLPAQAEAAEQLDGSLDTLNAAWAGDLDDGVRPALAWDGAQVVDNAARDMARARSTQREHVEELY